MTRPAVIVVGGGAIGASTARHLARRGVAVLLLEKEAAPALHQSSRNSGVIHSGYNLKPGTLKAQFCVSGSRALRQYCVDHHIPMQQNGILIVAQNDADRAVLRELHGRAQANAVRAHLLDSNALRELEPHAVGVEALHAPDGASFDAPAYVLSLLAQARQDGTEVRCGTLVRRIEPADGVARPQPAVYTATERLTASVVVNCAGLQCDRLAGALAADVRVVPFRGYYAELVPACRNLVRSHIYATPNLSFPFLGVHLSRRTDGRVIVGPGAMLAFGREVYGFGDVNLRDLADTLRWPGFWRMLADRRFLRLARDELLKSLMLMFIAREARRLVPELRTADLVRSYAGNRAQLVSRDGKLVDDIVVRESGRVVHVLNAVSPGLTCSLPFGEHLAERAMVQLGTVGHQP
jgi:L-2-hydroxyglutarate oxidase